jgi:hypothetical protein
MKKILKYILLLTLAPSLCFGWGFFKNIGNDSGFKDYPKNPTEVIGLGRDYTWTTGGQENFIKMLVRNKINTTSIELAGWANKETKKGQTFLYRDKIGKVKPHYEELLSVARRYKVLVIVSVVNDNKGTRKYGDDGRPLDQFKQDVEDAMNLVLKNGPNGVWVQVVAETQTAYGRQVEEKWIKKFREAGFNVIYNQASRPSGPAFGANMFAWHNCSLNDFGKSNCILIPDCGAAIAAYTEGGLNGPSLKANVLEDFARKVKAKKNVGLCIYTGWALQNVNEDAVKALARGWGVK